MANSKTPSAEAMWQVLQGIARQLESAKTPAIPAPIPAPAVATPAKVRTTNAVITYRVSPKGAVSAYGLGRFPVTLYANQWESLMAGTAGHPVLAFIAANRTLLAKD